MSGVRQSSDSHCVSMTGHLNAATALHASYDVDLSWLPVLDESDPGEGYARDWIARRDSVESKRLFGLGVM